MVHLAHGAMHADRLRCYLPLLLCLCNTLGTWFHAMLAAALDTAGHGRQQADRESACVCVLLLVGAGST